MKKKTALLILPLIFITACGKQEKTPQEILGQPSYDAVNIYVSNDVDVLGNKIENDDEIIFVDNSIKDSGTENDSQEGNISSTHSGLEVYFIDVGQADAVLIRIDNEENILIDGGNNADGKDLSAYLKYLGVENIDTVIATHPHEDHIGATDVVISEIPTDIIYMPYVADSDIPTTKTYKDLLVAIEDNDVVAIAAENGMKIYDTDYCELEIISPDEVKPGNLNDYSIVTKLTYGDISFLFTGDAEEQVNDYIMNNYSSDFLDVDVLKAGHHGSRTSNSKQWTNATKPEHVVIMCGKDNSYGHPHKEAIEAYKDTEVLRTDLDGTIKMTTDGHSLNIETKQTGDISLGDDGFSLNSLN